MAEPATERIQGKHTGRLNKAEALKMKLKGCSYQEIAKAQGVVKSTVHEALAPLLNQLPNVKELTEYKQVAADAFHLTAWRMLRSITDEDISKLAADRRVIAAAVSTDKARLISGESTANVSMILGGIMSDDPVAINNPLTSDPINDQN